MEGIHHRDRCGDLLGRGGLEPGEPVHRDHLDPVAPRLGASAQPLLERLLRASLDHVQQPCWAGAVPDGCEVDDHGDVLVAAPGVPPDVLIDAENLDAVEPVRIVDQDPLALGQDGVVGGVPGDPESFSDTGDGQVLAHDAFERPPQTTPRELRPRLSSQAGVLAPHMPAAGAPIATDRDHQRGRPPTQRLVRQTPGHCVARRSLASAATTPPLIRPVGLDDATGQDSTVRLEPLPGHFETELVESAEHGQIRAGKARPRGSVRHVEVFRMGSVRTSIFGRPRPLPGHRRADHRRRRHHTPATPSTVKSP